jgi:hypothetical protein
MSSPEVHAAVKRAQASRLLRAYLALEFRALLDSPHFIDALPGHLPPDAASQSRLPMLLHRIEELTEP